MSFPDGNKKIKILYTGGTMGMKKGADGALSPVAGYLTHEIHTNFVEGHADDMPTLSIKVQFSDKNRIFCVYL